jgi:hypothetical protein
MRPLAILLIALPLVVSTAGSSAAGPAVAKTDGATYLQLQEGHGFASTRVRGNYFGRVEQGRIVATANVSENGCEVRKRLAHGLRLCRGHDVTFRTPTDKRWRVRLRGHGISATGFVRGCLRLDGRNTGSTGSFTIGFGSEERSWPRTRTSYRLGTGTC